MNWKKSSYLFAAASLLILTAQVQATSMLHMDLGELATRADKIFRGTVISVKEGTVETGGGELPAVTYRLRVDELFKGQATEVKGDKALMEIRMIGSLVHSKPGADGVVKLSGFRDVPKLKEGGDYVLFTTAESSIGLSVTVGLGQGAFNVYSVDGARDQFMAVNEFNNAGLGLNGAGPVEYDKLSAQIHALLSQ
ncbi:MAG: hypothetical protein KJO82_02320 [Gammaproteobacteria bacterium]|nr:hypothetical protein [Gammaproteobacteria bacterium]